MKKTLIATADYIFKSPEVFLKTYWFLLLFSMKSFLIVYFRSCITFLDMFWIPYFYLFEILLGCAVTFVVWTINQVQKWHTLKRVLIMLVLLIMNMITVTIYSLVLASIYRVGIFCCYIRFLMIDAIVVAENIITNTKL